MACRRPECALASTQPAAPGVLAPCSAGYNRGAAKAAAGANLAAAPTAVLAWRQPGAHRRPDRFAAAGSTHIMHATPATAAAAATAPAGTCASAAGVTPCAVPAPVAAHRPTVPELAAAQNAAVAAPQPGAQPRHRQPHVSSTAAGCSARPGALGRGRRRASRAGASSHCTRECSSGSA